jgi:hypothetical protein
VYLPSANADALQLKIESLEAQMAEQQQLANERVEALMQDRQLREQVCSLQVHVAADAAKSLCVSAHISAILLAILLTLSTALGQADDVAVVQCERVCRMKMRIERTTSSN